MPTGTSRAAWALALGADAVSKRRPKYGAHALELDGIRFDSRREATRYQELKFLLVADCIRELEVHPAFPLIVLALYRDGPPYVFETVGRYTADFRYIDTRSGEVVIEDVKSGPTKTTAYRLRKRLVEAMHGIQIREIE